jgi:two-component system response regulator FlrC
LAIPALRQRAGDILPLAAMILSRYCSEATMKRISPGAQQALVAYPWPGNVRELENVMQRALVFCTGDTLEAEHLVFDDLDAGDTSLALRSPQVSAFDVATNATRAMGDFSRLQADPDLAPDTDALAMANSYDPPSPLRVMHGAGGVSAETNLAEPVSAATAQDDAMPSFAGSDPIRLPELVKTNEKKMILAAIEASPTRAEAARRLGISPRTLRYKMAQLKMAGAA